MSKNGVTERRGKPSRKAPPGKNRVTRPRSRAVALAWLAPIMLAACASQEADRLAQEEQGIRDYIAVAELEETDRIRARDYDGMELITDRFLLYKTRRQHYLVEFSRRCREIREREVTPDVRWDPNTIQAKFDTIGGCRIHKIYQLDEGQSAEVEQLGESPGDRS